MNYSAARAELRRLGARSKGPTNAVIVAEAMRRGIEVSTTEAGRVLLSYAGRSHIWSRQRTHLNTEISRLCARHADVASRLLRARGIRTPAIQAFGLGEESRAWEWAQVFTTIALRPPAGLRDRSDAVFPQNFEDFHRSFQHLADQHQRVLVEEVFPGVTSGISGTYNTFQESAIPQWHTTVGEHRVLAINGSMIAAVAIQPVTGEVVDTTDAFSAQDHVQIRQIAGAFPGLRLAHFHLLRGYSDDELIVLGIDPAPVLALHHFPDQGPLRDVAADVVDELFPGTSQSSTVHRSPSSPSEQVNCSHGS